MRKLFFTMLAAGSLILSNSATDAEAAIHSKTNAITTAVANQSITSEQNLDVEQVASSKATKMSGTYKFKYNTNVRQDAGTKYKKVTLAKKGATATATYKKKVGSQTWYKVKVGSKSGWVLSTLVSKTTVKKAATKTTAKKASSSSKATAKSGTYKLKYNTNVRQDAGTKYKVVTVGKKGATATASQQKKVGSQTWYKVKVGSKSGWVLSTLLTPATAKKASSTVKKASSSSSIDSKVVSEALALRGTPYVFGGTTTRGFDCSGFIQYVFKQAGKSVSRTTLTQYAETHAVSSPQPGDLVFFANTYRAGISHVGIYIGNNQFVHAGGSKAAVVSLNDSYWGKKFHSFRSF
ncbi:C40 family peptidase [Planomicrobium sp. CPCC 101079]|uniref:C40 family peptidase n=1 Tax=Planomicrobium sp. CPCC 101079 TaxID=2599618 RepID=UPI0011B6661A|nr:C40 family peptidase [Planomicrobium sp. CPCC 101079]TWT03581.1 SH3 domain-containing protein [Planomicrobium sp. CPCC 101079]